MAQRLAALVMQVFAVVSTPLTAAVGALWAKGDWQGIRFLYERVGSWVAIVVGLAGFSLWTLRKALFVLWLGQDYPEAHPFLLLILFGVTSAIIFSGVGVALAKGIGQPGLETTYTLVTLILTVLSKPLLIYLFGPLGSVASSAACWCLGAVFLLLLVHRKLQLPARMIRRTSGIFAATIALSILGWKLGQLLAAPPGRLEAALALVALGPLSGLVYLGALAALGLARFSTWRQVPADSVGEDSERRRDP
jgi:O-antigen/teichoic acid export membrane protein